MKYLNYIRSQASAILRLSVLTKKRSITTCSECTYYETSTEEEMEEMGHCIGAPPTVRVDSSDNISVLYPFVRQDMHACALFKRR